MTRRVLTITEAAAELGRTRDFVRLLISNKLVDGRKVGRRWMITEASIDAWIREGREQPKPPEEIYEIPGVVIPRRGRRRRAAA